MSSNATLAGQKADGVYQTMIVVDGHAYGYTGNELKSIDYPTSAKTIFMKGGNIASNNGKNSFNAIAIAAENLIDSSTSKAVDTTQNLTGHTFTIKNVDDEIMAWSDDNKTGCTDISNIVVVFVEGRYYLNLQGAMTYSAVEAAEYNASLAGAVSTSTMKPNSDPQAFYTTAEAEAYNAALPGAVSATTTKALGDSATYDAEILINSDFSNKVVVFTTFG